MRASDDNCHQIGQSSQSISSWGATTSPPRLFLTRMYFIGVKVKSLNTEYLVRPKSRLQWRSGDRLHYALAMRINSRTNEDSAKEPRWLALIAVLAAGLVYAALPNSLSAGPHWLLLAIIAPVSVSALISHRVGHHTADKMMGYAASGILTIAMTWSLGLLVAAIPKHKIDPKSLLRSAVALGQICSLYAGSSGNAAMLPFASCTKYNTARFVV